MKPEPTTGADRASDAGLAGAAAAGDPGDPSANLEWIQGTWATVAMIVDGRMLPEAALRQRRVIIIDDRYAVVDGSRTLRRGSFRIDPTASPKRIDTFPADGPNAGQVTPGIYVLTGDLLRLCYAPSGQPRPDDFAAALGSGRWLVTDRREPPAVTPRVNPAIVVASDPNPGVAVLHATRVHHHDLPELCGRGATYREAAVDLLRQLVGESGAVADGWHRDAMERVIADIRAFLDQAG
jgi:uncharacterized protein (TIGR03067 family)